MMPVSARLALADALHYPGRVAGASVALLAASCLVVWVVSAYDKLVSEFEGTAQESFGHYDLFLLPDSLDEKAIVSEQLLRSLGNDSRIANIDRSLRGSVELKEPSNLGERRNDRTAVVRGQRPGPRSPVPKNKLAPQPSVGPQQVRALVAFPTLVGIDAAVPPYPLVAGRWLIPEDSGGDHAVISEQLAESRGWDVGQTITVTCDERTLALRVVGIVAQPESVPTLEKTGPTGRPLGSAIGPALALPPGAIYVPLEVAQTFLGRPGQANFLCLKLRKKRDVLPFLKDWRDQLKPFTDGMNYLAVDFQQMEKAFAAGRASHSIRSQAWTACGLTILAAAFLIFTTLNMGVDERSRYIGLCRIVGLTKSQMAWTVFIQAVILAILGWLGGLLSVFLVLQLGHQVGLNIPWSGVIGPYTLGLSAVVTILGATIAALWPMLRAGRVPPLEALQPRHANLLHSTNPLKLLPLAALGTVFIMIHPMVVFLLPLKDSFRVWIAITVGAPMAAIGFLCWTPALVVAVEWICSPVLAFVMCVPRQLCKMELARNLPRSVATCMALSVGLGVFSAMMVWGYSMLEPFKPTDWAPDMLAAFQSGSVPKQELQTIASIPGVKRYLPAAVEQPKLAEDLTHASEGASVTRQDNVIIMGVDPDLAFGEDDPLFHLDFVKGSRREIIRRLKSERGCIVPDHFVTATGLDIGDTFRVVSPNDPQKTLEYKIVGVVSLPGWHWMTKFSGLRRRYARSAALIFAEESVVRFDFDLKNVNFIWIDLAKNADLEVVCRKLQDVADRHLGEVQPVNIQGTWSFGARMFGRSLRVTLRDEIYQRVTQRADTMIWAMARLPFVTLLITLPGLMSVINASVRIRQWEFGIMRAIGFTSSLIARQIVVEGLLLATVAAFVSVLFGIVSGWCGIGLSQYTSFFGGMQTPLVIPWRQIAIGVVATFLICGIAAVPGAIVVLRREPLKLFLAGRGSE